VTYVEVHGLRTWHEVTGAGQPVVLLHGAFAGAASWSGQAPVLADAGYKVHVPERRGHAHTPDVPGPLTYQVMADDTVAYLDGVVGGPASDPVANPSADASPLGNVHDGREGSPGVASAAVLRPSANWLNESVMSGIVLVMRPDSGPLSSSVMENSVPPATSSSR
jgi:hypothetical protein